MEFESKYHGIKLLIQDIHNDIGDFQPESDEEISEINRGLKAIIELGYQSMDKPPIKPESILDPEHEDYWVGQKVTLPPIDTCAEDWDMGEEEFNKIKSQEGKIVLITHVEVPVDGARESYYNFRTQVGYEFNMNFNIYPLEMAIQFRIAGHDHFAREIPLDEHPHLVDRLFPEGY